MSQGFGEILFPPMGTMDMDSVPPAMMTSAAPERMRSAARAMACRPEEQKRLMVMAEHSTGRPARSEARDVHPLLAFGHGAAEDDVVDLPGVEAGDAGDGRADGAGGEIVGASG